MNSARKREGDAGPSSRRLALLVVVFGLAVGAGVLLFTLRQRATTPLDVGLPDAVDRTPSPSKPSPDLQAGSASTLDRKSTERSGVSLEAVEAEREPPPPTGIQLLAADIDNDLRKLRELKLFGTASRVANDSTYLMEDVLGRTFRADEPYPREILSRHGSYTASSGPNGPRVYSFPRTDYPLFFEILERDSQNFDDVLDDEFVERVATFAEEALAMAGYTPR